MVTYGELGVRPVINAHNTLTMLGGSIMPGSVVTAMADASRSFVDMAELNRAASERIARLTRNEDGLVVAGASAGLLLAALATMTRGDQRLVARQLEHGSGALDRTEIVMQRAHRIPYDTVLTLAGAEIVEAGNAIQTHDWELEAAVTERTAAIVYIAGSHLQAAALPFAAVARIAAAREVPLVVDAAAQLPPRENLWWFTENGADLVVFSGGKEIRGPQASGLLLGSRRHVDACRQHAFPLQRFGRPAKVGKEEIMGLLTALDLWLDRDTAADLARAETTVTTWAAELSSLLGVSAERDWPGEAGRPMPRLLVSWDDATGPDASDVAADLAAQPMPIIVSVASTTSFWLNPELLTDDEVPVVSSGVQAALTRQRVAVERNVG